MIAHELPAGSHVGIAVYDLTAGEMIYSYQADKLSRPASTMKLLTAITALSRPEADEPFRTEVWYKGEIAADTLHGDLYVIGGYDPELDDEAMDSLVNQVLRLPLSVIDGHVYGDVSMKDSLYWGSGWSWDDTPASFQPYLSPLMFCKGAVQVEATAGVKGDTAQVTCKPASTYYTVRNEARTRLPEAGKFSVSRDWLTNGNNLVIKGNVTGLQKGSVNIYGSPEFFMHTFVERLQQRGISMLPATNDSIPVLNDTVPYAFHEMVKDSASVFVCAYETPIQIVLKQLMKESDNLNAEALLCRLGAQATGKRHIAAEEGLSAINRLIKRLGLNPAHYRVADGCGLSNYNQLSPELLVSFLRHAYSHTKIFQRLYKALPISGVDGTLAYRMRRGTPAYQRVHAKTGTISGISSLAGYLQQNNKHELAFAIMNQGILSGREARAFQDKVCNELVK